MSFSLNPTLNDDLRTRLTILYEERAKIEPGATIPEWYEVSEEYLLDHMTGVHSQSTVRNRFPVLRYDLEIAYARGFNIQPFVDHCMQKLQLPKEVLTLPGFTYGREVIPAAETLQDNYIQDLQFCEQLGMATIRWEDLVPQIDATRIYHTRSAPYPTQSSDGYNESFFEVVRNRTNRYLKMHTSN